MIRDSVIETIVDHKFVIFVFYLKACISNTKGNIYKLSYSGVFFCDSKKKLTPNWEQNYLLIWQSKYCKKSIYVLNIHVHVFRF